MTSFVLSHSTYVLLIIKSTFKYNFVTMRIHFIFFSLLLSVNFLYSQAQWSHEGSHYITEVSAGNQDEIWLGASSTIIRLNPETSEFEEFQAWNSEVVGSYVSEIFVDKGKNVWAAMGTGGINRYNGSEWIFYKEINGDTINRYDDFQCTERGIVWFRGGNMIYSFDGEEFVSHNEIPAEISHFAVFDELIYCYDYSDEKLYRYTIIDSKLEEIPRPENGEYISGLMKIGDDLLCISNSGEYYLSKFVDNEWQEVHQGTKENWRIFHTDTELWLTIYQDGKISFVNYQDGQITEYTDEIFAHVPEFENSTRYILHDIGEDGTFWFTLYAGTEYPQLFRVKQDGYRTYDTNLEGPYSGSLQEINHSCNDGIVFLDGQYLDVYQNSEWISHYVGNDTLVYSRRVTVDNATCTAWFTMENPYTHDDYLVRYDLETREQEVIREVSSLISLHSENGVLYIAASEDPDGPYLPGLGLFDGNVWEWHIDPFVNPSFPSQNTIIYDIMIASDGKIYCSTGDAGLLVYDGSNWRSFNETNSLVNNKTDWTYEDLEGNIWSYHPYGVLKYDGDDWEYFELPTVWSGISGMVQDAQGYFWISTWRQGLWLWNGVDLVIYNIENSCIAENYINEMIMDNEGRLWLNHDRGVSVLDPGEISTRNGVFGKVYFDSDMNEEFDLARDARISNEKIISLPDSTISITNSNGSYSFYPKTEGGYQYSLIESTFESTTKMTLDTTFNGQSIEGMDFGVWKSIIGDSLSIDIVSGHLVCLQDNSVWVTVTNYGINNVSGRVELEFDEHFEDVQTIPDYVTLDSDYVMWDFEELRYLESRSFYLILKGPSIEDILEMDPDQEPDEILLEFKAQVETSQFSASDVHSELFLCSYDPNDKRGDSVGESLATSHI